MNLKKWPARGWVELEVKRIVASIPLDKFSRDRRVAARNKRQSGQSCVYMTKGLRRS